MTDPIDGISPGSLKHRDTDNEFVCWLDMMGTKSIMSRSLEEYSIKMFKLHNTALLAEEEMEDSEDLTLYPVMDGVYIVSKTKHTLEEYLRLVFNTLAQDIIDEREVYHRFIIRAAVAFGPIVHGQDIPEDATQLDDTFKDTLLLGFPMVQAFGYEKEAPPFGIYIHESARSFTSNEGEEEPFRYVWWKWFEPFDRAIAVELREILAEYYEWAKDNSRRIGYEFDKIEEHEKLAKQYYPEEPKPSDSPRTPPVSEGDIERVTIDDLGDEGDGIAKVGDSDYVIFVDGAKIDDEVDVRINDVYDNYAFGTVEDIS